jgi:hypothetical protein
LHQTLIFKKIKLKKKASAHSVLNSSSIHLATMGCPRHALSRILDCQMLCQASKTHTKKPKFRTFLTNWIT